MENCVNALDAFRRQSRAFPVDDSKVIIKHLNGLGVQLFQLNIPQCGLDMVLDVLSVVYNRCRS